VTRAPSDRYLEVIVALACIGTAVTLYPVLKRQNEGMALGFAAARVLEAGMIFTGVVSLLLYFYFPRSGIIIALAANSSTDNDDLQATAISVYQTLQKAGAVHS
jgi:Domain of unknown function (DUF4386)